MRAATVLLTVGLAGPAGAEIDLSALTPGEEAVLRTELLEVLATLPNLLPPGPARPAPAPYAEAVASDLARIAALSERLFGPAQPGFGPSGQSARLALFTQEDCAACAAAETELRALAAARNLRVTLLDMDEHADLAHGLDLDMAPSYVFPDMLLRGHMPEIVLERYLDTPAEAGH